MTRLNSPLIFLLILSVIFSCSKESSSTDELAVYPSPSSFTINTNKTYVFSVDLEWTKATITDNTSIKYDIYLANILIAQDIGINSYTISDLQSETSYSGKIVAKSIKGKSSEQAYTFTTKNDETPSDFEVNVEILSKSEAQVSWTASTLSSGEAVLYDIYIYDDYYKKETVFENISGLEYLLGDLYYGVETQLKVTAKSPTGKTVTVETSFQTYGTPPSDFTLSYEQIDPNYWIFSWEHPTVEDGSDYHYELFINGELHHIFNNDGNSSTAVQNLDEGTEYTVTLVADATYNNTKTESTLTFVTNVYPRPSDFEISVETVSATKLFLDWTPSTMADGTLVIYYLYLNGERFQPNNYWGSPGHVFENLLPDTEYTFRVEASETANNKTTSKDFTFRTYPVHPSILVDKAVLYLPGSQFFEKQLNVSFIENIENVDIAYFHAGGNVDIQSFLFYPKAISSGQLDAQEINSIAQYPVGNVVIRENGTLYIVDFDIVLESN